MDRRQFLGAAAVSAAGLGAIGWLGHILFLPSVPDALRQAKSLGKAVLVLVIPEDKGRQYRHGAIFGALLNHGDTYAYLDLALCELACAPVKELQERGINVAGEPLMLLLESDFPHDAATPIDPDIPETLPSSRDVGFQRANLAAEERMYTVAGALQEALAARPIATRARRAEAHLPRREVNALHATLEAGRIPDPTALDRGAAIVRAFGHAHRDGDLLAALADATAGRVKGAPPGGAKWARATGCGTYLEEDGPNTGIGCGMGFVPDVSKRFLSFYTQ